MGDSFGYHSENNQLYLREVEKTEKAKEQRYLIESLQRRLKYWQGRARRAEEKLKGN